MWNNSNNSSADAVTGRTPRRSLAVVNAVLAASLVLGLAAAGCSSSYKAEELTTADLLFRNSDLQGHLQERREHLATLQSRLDAVDADLVMALGRLSSMRRQLAEAESKRDASASELESVRRQIEDEIARRESLRRQMAAISAFGWSW